MYQESSLIKFSPCICPGNLCAFSICTQVILGSCVWLPLRPYRWGFFLSETACAAKKMLACLLCQFTHDIAITCQRNNSVPGREPCHKQPLAGPHSSLPRLLKLSFLIKVTAILKVTHNVVTCTSCQQTKQHAGTSLPTPLQVFFCINCSGLASRSQHFCRSPSNDPSCITA